MRASRRQPFCSCCEVSSDCRHRGLPANSNQTIKKVTDVGVGAARDALITFSIRLRN